MDISFLGATIQPNIQGNLGGGHLTSISSLANCQGSGQGQGMSVLLPLEIPPDVLKKGDFVPPPRMLSAFPGLGVDTSIS